MYEIPSVPVTITRIKQETPTIKTFEFSESFDSGAGHFCMVWVPGVDEIPMALSSQNSITVQKVGEATAALFSLKEGDKIGIKGPLGNGFTTPGRTLVIAGGIGAAPLRPLAKTGQADTFLLGARTADELVFVSELETLTEDLRIATDDGTRGYHGFVTGLMNNLNLASYDQICVCGPEIMMKNVLRILTEQGLAKKTQISLVRYMKCGVGLCGSCCIDPEGLCVCKDGPVFTGDVLLNSEFGEYARDACGRRQKI